MTRPATAAALEVATIDSEQHLAALAPEWWALWQRLPTATPFQTPEWVLAWWRHFGAGRLMVLAVRRDDRLVGVAPLWVRSDAHHARTLRFIGAAISDYLDALIDPECDAEIASALIEHLADAAHDCDAVDLDEIPAGSPLLGAEWPDGWTCAVARRSSCPAIALPRTMDEYLATLSAGRRRKLRVAERKQRERGSVRIERASAHTVRELLEELFALHAARWRERRQSGVLADARVRALHLEVAPALHRRGVLRLHRLRIDGRTAAVLYGFRGGDRWFAYLGGFDPALEEVSPGTTLMAHIIGQAIAERCASFDLMRGREGYKYAWRARDRYTYRLTAQRAPEEALP